MILGMSNWLIVAFIAAAVVTGVAAPPAWKELPAPKTRQLALAKQKCADMDRSMIFIVLHHGNFGFDRKHAVGFMGNGVESVLRKNFVCMTADESDAEITALLSKETYSLFLTGHAVYLGITPDGKRLGDGIFRFDRGPKAIQEIQNALSDNAGSPPNSPPAAQSHR